MCNSPALAHSGSSLVDLRTSDVPCGSLVWFPLPLGGHMLQHACTFCRVALKAQAESQTTAAEARWEAQIKEGRVSARQGGGADLWSTCSPAAHQTTNASQWAQGKWFYAWSAESLLLTL